jgi:predicted GH43/DUF377 family glycosyl hydrolase
MIKCIKTGIVFSPGGADISWADNSALQPTPIILEDRVRVFVGMRDALGVSRVGYVDLSKDDPTKVIGVSEKPVLDIGLPGRFDENGVVPCAVVHKDGKLYLFYAGYQLPKGVRFLVFSGLAISTDNGNTFERYAEVPILERSHAEPLFRVIHTINYENGRWRVWYGGGDKFIEGKNKTLPVYNVRYFETANEYDFPATGKILLDMEGEEYRIGRPFVFTKGGLYYMFYGYSSQNAPYTLGFAVSEDGTNWTRKDDELNLPHLPGDFDDQMSAYPAIIDLDGRYFLFYNGNEYGKYGFGCAEMHFNS